MRSGNETKLRIFTIGHSNRPLEDFIALLKNFHIETLTDIRRFPGSRKFPYFNRETLQKTLKTNRINYIWLESLGGRRHGTKNIESKNTGLRSPAFRNYADYMATQEFRTAIGELLKIAASSTVAIMCAEILYWRCHRKLVSDYLLAHSVTVTHILQCDKFVDHSLTTGAVITAAGEVTYPSRAETGSLFEFDNRNDKK